MDQRGEMLQEFKGSNGKTYVYYSLSALGLDALPRLPFSVKVVLESLLRHQQAPGGQPVRTEAFAQWPEIPADAPEHPYLPARVLLQDFTGVPCVADLAAMRGVLAARGLPPERIEPQLPIDLVIDHSVQLDCTARPDALEKNLHREFERNRERYAFLRWSQQAFRHLRIVPPGVGICHQVNLEYLASVVATRPDAQGRMVAYPDSLVGTDSHTTMINGLGVLGWGVGGIEAEAAMLGQPIPLLTPVVTGVRLAGKLKAGVTATDLALTLTQRLREASVVGQFVEFCGPGLEALSLADRATVANMAPEYGATVGFFPVDAETLRYLRETGRSDEQVDLVERYCRAQGLWREPGAAEPVFQRVLDVDLGAVAPVVAGPKKPHDRVSLGNLKAAFRKLLTAPVQAGGYGLAPGDAAQSTSVKGVGSLTHGTVVLASITSCTNTSNPAVLLAAGLLAKKAVARGLTVPRVVRTSLAPGSRVVTAYLKSAGLLESLEKLGFHVAAYGCATCIGNSGPLDPRVEAAIKAGKFVAAAVLSGNRNFEGRVHPAVRANFLCSPPLVVAFALAGRVDIDLRTEPLGRDQRGRPVFLKELWPSDNDIRACLGQAQNPALYRELYADPAAASPDWAAIPADGTPVFRWDPASTYIRNPPFVVELPAQPAAPADLAGARCLVLLGDFITTDHISPAGSIPADSPAGQYLQAQGVKPEEFNSYGARRGNHEVMMRGTFASVRLRNRLVEREGGWTLHFPDGEPLSIYDAAVKYRAEGVPAIVIASKLYGAGSSRDWAAKGPYLLGVRAVIAQSFERIHRSNLIGMGILPLEFVDGQSAESLGLTGHEAFGIAGVAAGLAPGQRLEVTAVDGARTVRFQVKCRIDAAIEAEYVRHGGILPYVLRRVMAERG